MTREAHDRTSVLAFECALLWLLVLLIEGKTA